MDTSTAAVSPLRQRMLDDMRMRKFGEKTQLDYVRAVRNFTKYLGRLPDTASVEDLRNYQLHLVDHGISPASLNSTISGLKFFFNVTLDLPELMAKMQPVSLLRLTPRRPVGAEDVRNLQGGPPHDGPTPSSIAPRD
jgi:site-specific recombinase XerD